MRRYLIFLILDALVALAVFAGGRASVAQALVALVDYVRNAGALGIAVFAAVYVVSAVALLPGAALTLAAGFVYGSLVTNVSDLLAQPAAGSQPAAAQWLYWGGFAATLAVAVLVTRTARHALAQALAPGDAAL